MPKWTGERFNNADFTASDLRRFFAKVQPASNGCSEWVGIKTTKGYGLFKLRGHNRAVHRVAWIIHNGPIPEGVCVCHRCDNRCCVERSHLFLGTVADNNHDRDSKGRLVVYSGERHHAAKLTWVTVNAMREAYADGASRKELQARFGVSKSQVQRIVTGAGWKVPVPA